MMDITTDRIYKIGRRPDSDIVLDAVEVSGHHAEIFCLSANNFVLTDLDSSNGTFVNGIRVKRCLVNRTDDIKIAAVTLKLDKHFPAAQVKDQLIQLLHRSLAPETPAAASTAPASTAAPSNANANAAAGPAPQTPAPASKAPQGPAPQAPQAPQAPSPQGKSDPNDFASDFSKLQEAYKQYSQAKLKLQLKQGGDQLLMRGVPVALGPLLVGLLSLEPITGSIIGFVGSVAGILGSKYASKQEKLNALDDEFKTVYVCPKCKMFLGFMPWESLAQKKACVCKAIWAK